NVLATIPEKDKSDTPQRHTQPANGQAITSGEDAANEAAGVEATETIPVNDKLVMALSDEDDTEFVSLALSTSSENSYKVERQPHSCPRCGQDRIVGVNGSKRWCISCEATWKKEDDFLTEVTDQSGTPALRTLVQRRFLELLSHLDKVQLGQVEAWLDDLEQNLPQPNAAAAAMN
ncbi:MAG: hypothetical protein GY792_25375, partial [Gammaproteobacteria bacterium]|nr:hypothetical protein [Gammaproteobacteria bacterium]